MEAQKWVISVRKWQLIWVLKEKAEVVKQERGVGRRGCSQKAHWEEKQMCDDISIWEKGQPAQYGWREWRRWKIDWNVCERTPKITPEYLKSNFTAWVLAEGFQHTSFHKDLVSPDHGGRIVWYFVTSLIHFFLVHFYVISIPVPWR